MQLHGLGLTCEIFQVPVIAVFTKFDQFKRDMEMKLEDQHDPNATPDDQGHDPLANLDDEVEKVFGIEYKARLGGSPLFVRLESKFF
jgi:hypothetical protein